MKLPNKNIIPYYVYGIASVCICLFIALAVFNFAELWNICLKILDILSPFIIGFSIAFIFNPVMNILEHRVFGRIKTKKPKNRLWRILSLIITYILAIFISILTLAIIIPEVAASIGTLVENLGSYAQTVTEWVNSVLDRENEFTQFILEFLPQIQEAVNKFLTDTLTNIKNLQSLFEFGKGLASGVINFIMGIFISTYILLDKDRFKARFKKLIYALFKPKTTTSLIYWFSYSANSMTKYISGKLLDSLVVGLICFIFMTIFGWPFPILISVIIGITNIIPFFGPFIGTIPSAIIIFIHDPMEAFWFVIFIIALQQVEGNIIGPFIVGDSVGLSSFWTVFAILVFGGIFGIPGMILGIPFFAVFYAIFKTVINARLEKNGLPTDTSEYLTANAKRYNKNENSKYHFGQKLKNRIIESTKNLDNANIDENKKNND